MSLSMYDISIPTFIRGLENLTAVLKKGEAYASENGLNEADLTTAKLAEDMFPLTRQVQIASDAAKGAAARISGQEVPSYEDNEVTFADLYARIDKTISFLKTVTPEQMEGGETRQVQFTTKGGSYDFSGRDYLLGMSFPNFFFHTTTAYDILRNRGVQLGKKDYLGAQ